MSVSEKIIIISGPPGSGKTTLARPLAKELGFSLISKDDIKEPLSEKLEIDYTDLKENRKIGGAAMEVMWKLAESCPQVILEANFRPHSDYERKKILGLKGQLIEVHCRCSEAEVIRRFAKRAKSSAHHPVHTFTEITPEMLTEYDQAVGIGKLIEVSTEKTINLDRIVMEINKIWGRKS